MAATYRFLITDPIPNLVACTYQPSQNAPGKTICVSENGLALVVEPRAPDGSILIRDLRPGEDADSPWCWADRCGDLLVYRPDAPTIVAFRVVES
jgi:hypothetical protein